MSSSSKRANPKPQPKSAPQVAIPGVLIAVALAPVALSGYLLMLSLTGDSAAGCGVDTGCGSVLTSQWSRWFGIPVAGLALPVYLALVSALIVLKRGAGGPRVPKWFFEAVLGALVGGAAWFLYVQKVLIGAFCPWCLATHVSGIVAASLALKWIRRGVVSPMAFPALAGAVAASVGVLALGQSAGPSAASPSTGSVVRTPASNSVPAPAVPVEVKRSWTLPISGTTISLNEVPLLGSPTATNLLLHLFDYTCKHCRAMHPVLMQVMDQSSNSFAVVSLPVPLDMECNPFLKRPIQEHLGACAVAKVGLAVWKAAPNRFREFDDWIFGLGSNPTPEVAEAHAIELVGAEAYHKARSSPDLDALLRLSFSVYEKHYRLLNKQNLPELLVGTNLYTGPVRDPKVLKERIDAAFPAGSH
jgi:uncharacterized membrane protein/protein-disulfide isomerase